MASVASALCSQGSCFGVPLASAVKGDQWIITGSYIHIHVHYAIVCRLSEQYAMTVGVYLLYMQ